MNLDRTKQLYSDKLGINLDISDDELISIGSDGWIDFILWKTAWQCEEYIISSDFFGQKGNQNGKYDGQQLVSWSKGDEAYWLRRIILDNVIFDIYMEMGRVCNVDKHLKSISAYLYAGLEHSGYYLLSEMVDDKGILSEKWIKKIVSKTYIETEKTPAVDAYKNARKNYKGSKDFFGFPHFENLRKSWFADRELETEEIKYNDEQVPLFDALLINRFLRRGWNLFKALKKMKGILDNHKISEKEWECSVWERIKSVAKQINRVQFGEKESDKESRESDFLDICDDEYKELKPLQKMDRIIFDFEIEVYLHGRLQIAITDFCEKLFKVHHVRMGKIEKKLKESVKMGFRFGMEYIFDLPLKYIDSPAITQGVNNTTEKAGDYYVDKDSANYIWIDRYCEYLSQLIYATVPIVRTALEYNFRSAVEKHLKKHQSSISEKEVNNRLFEELEKYVVEHMEIWGKLYLSSRCTLDYLKSNVIEKEGTAYGWFSCEIDKRRQNYSNNIESLKDYIHMAQGIVIKGTGDVQGMKYGSQFNHDSKFCIELDDRQGVKRDLLRLIYPDWFQPERFGSYRMKKVDDAFFSFQQKYAVISYENKIRELRKQEIVAYYSSSWESDTES